MASDGMEDPKGRMDAMRYGIREIAHDISSPLGVLRMAVYYLQTADPDRAKQEQYYRLMNETIDKVEEGLKRLRTLTGSGVAGRKSDVPGGGDDR
jgi:nitrogen-specific signal transduction histidine kinase